MPCQATHASAISGSTFMAIKMVISFVRIPAFLGDSCMPIFHMIVSRRDSFAERLSPQWSIALSFLYVSLSQVKILHYGI